jgi:hypothetical protein
MRTAIASVVITSLLFALSCSKEGDGGTETAASTSEAESTETKDDSKDEPRKRRKREKKDRGDASMTFGGEEWVAGRASARLLDDGNKLKLSFVKSNYTSGKSTRESVDLTLADYKGPGSYETKMGGSRFIGVGIDANAVKKAGNSDEATQKEAMKAIKGAKHMMLTGAKVEITSANDDEIVGTFSWQPQGGQGRPMENGKFRAKVRKPRVRK